MNFAVVHLIGMNTCSGTPALVSGLIEEAGKRARLISGLDIKKKPYSCQCGRSFSRRTCSPDMNG